MPHLECDTLFNEKRLVDAKDLVFRPSVYGLVTHQDTVLLIRTSATGRYEFPGGGIELGERMGDALRREFLEEAGIQVQVGELLLVKEKFFYHDRAQEAYHSFLFVYACTAHEPEVSAIHADIGGTHTEEPVWAPIASLREEDFGGSDREFFVELKQMGLL